MREIGVLEARTVFSALVAEVERTGEAVLVTRHGRPIVRISPAIPRPRLSAEERAALDEGRALASRDRQLLDAPSAAGVDVFDARG